MANERMFLVHIPSKLGVYLGKRMGWGWYGAPKDLTNNLESLYQESINHCEKASDQDDFKIMFELEFQDLIKKE